MLQAAELLGYLEREVLVRVESGHRSGSLVVLDLPLDFVTVGTMIGPDVRQILGSQGRIGAQQLGLARPQMPGLDQQPDGDPGADNAGLPATDLRRALDSREGITQILHYPLEDLGLFGSRHLGKQALSLL
jgi:hypothetical protein